MYAQSETIFDMYKELFGIKSKELIKTLSSAKLRFFHVDQTASLWNILVSLATRYASLKKVYASFIFDKNTIFDYFSELQNLKNVFTRIDKVHEKYDAIIVFLGDKTLSQQELYHLVSVSKGHIVLLGTYR